MHIISALGASPLPQVDYPYYRHIVPVSSRSPLPQVHLPGLRHIILASSVLPSLVVVVVNVVLFVVVNVVVVIIFIGVVKFEIPLKITRDRKVKNDIEKDRLYARPRD